MLFPIAAEEFTEEACNATPRLRAVAKGDIKYLSNSNDKGSHITALMVACWLNKLNIVNALLADSQIDARTEGGVSALCLAAECGQADIVKVLLDTGASIRIADGEGCTALHRASSGGHAACVQLLLNAKSDVNAFDVAGASCLMKTAYGNHVECTRLLLAANSPVEHWDRGGRNPLILACTAGNQECARLLMEANANVNFQDGSGFTPLIRGVRSGSLAVVKDLLEAGARTDLADAAGATPLSIAKSMGRDDLIQLLTEDSGGADDDSSQDKFPASKEDFQARRSTRISAMFETAAAAVKRVSVGKTAKRSIFSSSSKLKHEAPAQMLTTGSRYRAQDQRLNAAL